MYKKNRKKGFTLAELLIVIAIIAILIAIAVPVFSTSMRRAQKATDDGNFRAAKSVAVNAFLSGYMEVEQADGSLKEEKVEYGGGGAAGNYYIFTTNGNFAKASFSGGSLSLSSGIDPVTAKLTAEADKDKDYLIATDPNNSYKGYHKKGTKLYFYMGKEPASGTIHDADDSEAASDFYRLYDGNGNYLMLHWW